MESNNRQAEHDMDGKQEPTVCNPPHDALEDADHEIGRVGPRVVLGDSDEEVDPHTQAELDEQDAQLEQRVEGEPVPACEPKGDLFAGSECGQPPQALRSAQALRY